jgi:hypothetical protein
MELSSLLRLVCFPVVAVAETTLDPTLHLNLVGGISSADNPGDLASHAHDPNDDWALQGFDVGLNLRHDDWLAGFVNINAFSTPDGDLDAEWEEAFVKLQNLPGDFEIRAGRFQNRFGLENHLHQHSLNFVNSNLSTAQFLGEEALITEGLELTWLRKTDATLFALTGSFGKAAAHDDHEGEHEDEHEEEDEHAEHGGEDALFTDEVATLRALFAYGPNDFHSHSIGLNGAWGQNGYGNKRDTFLYSADYVYQWRENGLESGGREFSTGLEVFLRDVEWANDEGLSGRTSQNGFMAFGRYRFADQWIADLRYEELQGREPAEEVSLGEDRERLSLALTREFELAGWDSHARLQYNHDQLEEGSEDTVWLQFGFSFGGSEVR